MTTPTTSTALARTPTQDALASFNTITRDPRSITAALEKAQSVGHLVAPSTSISGGLPDGTSVALSAVLVDVVHETYQIAGSSNVGLGKTALDRIALALGVSWQESRRLDDGRDPHYCEYLAVGSVRQYDGTPLTIQASKVLDWRDKSPAIETLWARYREKRAAWERGGKQGVAPRSPEGQIRETRATLAARCETSARLRATRSLGIRTSYSKEELRKPFVAARLVFSGETEDPSLRREFAVMRAASFLEAKRALYGSSPPALPPAPRPPALPAPPIGRSLVEDDDVPDAELVEEPAGTTMPHGRDTAPAAYAGQDPAEGRQAADPSPPATVASTPTPAAPPASRSGFTIPGGRSKGTPIEDAEDRDLTYWAGRIEEDLANGRGSRSRDDAALVAAIRAEQGRRCGGGADSGGAARDDDSDIPF